MFDLIELVKTAGYFGIFGIIFAETGLFLGFFFPGDSLLFTAGFLASQGYLNVALLVIGCFLAAVLGNSFGYFFGKKIGPKLFGKEDSFLFHKKHLEEAKAFFEKHGGKTIILARFIPIVRTFAPIVAGVGKMNFFVFSVFNIIGAILWTAGLTLLGYYLGNIIPNVDRYILPIIALIIFASLLPAIITLIKKRSS